MKVFKILLGLFALGLLCVGACVGGVYFWISSNQEELAALAEEGERTGYEFGKDATADACLNKAFEDAAPCGGFDLVCETGVLLFLKACIDVAEIPPGFCDGVPATSSILDSATYRVEACKDGPMDNTDRCGRLMGAVQEYCEEQ
ncbi:MAG: hypothetical protein AAFQ82_01135 [Myxococcota bacterium]